MCHVCGGSGLITTFVIICGNCDSIMGCNKKCTKCNGDVYFKEVSSNCWRCHSIITRMRGSYRIYGTQLKTN